MIETWEEESVGCVETALVTKLKSSALWVERTVTMKLVVGEVERGGKSSSPSRMVVESVQGVVTLTRLRQLTAKGYCHRASQMP